MMTVKNVVTMYAHGFIGLKPDASGVNLSVKLIVNSFSKTILIDLVTVGTIR